MFLLELKTADEKTSKKPKLRNSTKFLKSTPQECPGGLGHCHGLEGMGHWGDKISNAWTASWDRKRASVGKRGKQNSPLQCGWQHALNWHSAHHTSVGWLLSFSVCGWCRGTGVKGRETEHQRAAEWWFKPRTSIRNIPTSSSSQDHREDWVRSGTWQRSGSHLVPHKDAWSPPFTSTSLKKKFKLQNCMIPTLNTRWAKWKGRILETYKLPKLTRENRDSEETYNERLSQKSSPPNRGGSRQQSMRTWSSPPPTNTPKTHLHDQ